MEHLAVDFNVPSVYRYTWNVLYQNRPHNCGSIYYGADEKEVVEALANGASGVLAKDTPNDKLIDALRRIMAGQRVVPPEVQRQIDEVSVFTSLSERQRAYLELAARGFSNADIVQQHNTTIDAVKKQFSAIFQKLGVTNRAEAIALAQRKHLLKE